jgi:hypothetical protein
MRFFQRVQSSTAKTLFLCTFCHRIGFGEGDWGEQICQWMFWGAATFTFSGASYFQRLDFHRAAYRSKMRSMAGCLSNTKRFRHGRPDRGRC